MKEELVRFLTLFIFTLTALATAIHCFLYKGIFYKVTSAAGFIIFLFLLITYFNKQNYSKQTN